MKTKDSVYFISLGCAKNLVDSENMLGLLRSRGYRIAAGPEEAGVTVVNTCGFIQPAVEEAIDAILEACRTKREAGKPKRVFVVGCFVQRYGYKLLKEIPEVDGWLGTGEIHRIADLLDAGPEKPPRLHIGQPRYLADHCSPRFQTTPFYSAYLKLAEGCSHRCTFCLIPALTGHLRSRSPESVLVEAEGMVERGVKEINLVAQDSTLYGRDLTEKACLEDLLEMLLEIRGINWVRLFYCHPQGISGRLLELLEADNALCAYLDVPLQHVNEHILKRMGRRGHGESPRELMERIRSRTSRLVIRTSLMVGFPGETDRVFEELLDFVRWAAFDNMGAFAFSPEKGTAACRFNDVVPRDVAEERRNALMLVQAEISEKKNRTMIGRTVPVLIEGLSEETDLLLKGRTEGMAPDVDGQVLINKGYGIRGEIVPVHITEAYAYDLVGEIIE
ncbi:MAG: 30S ribosomal protein S12 methylthiotransferase RimO [Desulfatiglandales bacterium]